jgi:hypothetical protein
LASLEDTVRRLFLISSLIAKSTTRDKFARAEVTCRELQIYVSYDISHVQEKLKIRNVHKEQKAGQEGHRNAECQENQWLAERLGRVNTKRRQFIAYSRSHRAALNKEVNNNGALPGKDIGYRPALPISENGSAGKSACFTEDVKSSIAQTKASTLADMDANVFDYGCDDARSTTTVAVSIMDDQAFSGLKVPPLAYYTELGEFFICPLCQTSQRFNGQEAWR